MKITKIIARVILGLILVVFGLNGFLQFMPMPEMTAEAGELMGAMAKAGYFFPIIAIVEIIVGLLLLINKYTALALIVLFPIMLNAFLFHLFLDIAGIGAATLALILNIFLVITNKEKYKGILEV
ncbi:MAG: DoxX family membrane protein [Bacteroidota bacterium]